VLFRSHTQKMRWTVMCLVLCVCFVAATPEHEINIDDLMRIGGSQLPPPSAVPDTEAGVPGSDTEDFPSNLLFAEPCPEMEDSIPDLPLPPAPTPTPTSDVPPANHIAWEVVGLLSSMCRKCHCGCHNMSRSESLGVAKEVFRLLPSVALQQDSCPAFLKKNPLFPESHSASASPSPSPSRQLQPQWVSDLTTDSPLASHDPLWHEMQKAALDVLRAKNELNNADKNDPEIIKQLTLKYHNTIHSAESRMTAMEETPESSMRALPRIPEDCEEDATGTVGLANDDVSGTSSGMNLGYSPDPRIYVARQQEALKQRAKIVEPLKLSFLQSDVYECTVYHNTRISSTSHSTTTTEADVPAECSKACVFSDGCRAWQLTGRECRLFNDANPTLVSGAESDIAGVCPGVQKCSPKEMSSVVSIFSSPAGRAANCSNLLQQLTTSAHVDMNGACECVSGLGRAFPSLDCTVSLESASFLDVQSTCKSYKSVPQQRGLPDCSHTGIFNAGLGSCLTYAEDASPITNFLHCDIDRDVATGLGANQACPQCGKCAPTPGPTPMTPPPSLAVSDTLPNGQTTECLQARASSRVSRQTGPLTGWYVPQCFMDGSYMPTQCLEAINMCWCVYENGVEIPETRFIATAPPSSRSICRPAPPMKPVVPVIPEPKGNEVLQAVRSLAKLVYANEPPSSYCRAKLNVTVEQLLMRHLRHNSTTASSYCTQRPLSFHSLLHMVSLCLVPPPPQPLTSPSPTPSLSASPSISESSSVSVSSSPSPSAAVPMCGDVVCTMHSKDAHIAANAPPGWCRDCAEGSSGPCRHGSTFECVDFMYGAHCNFAYQRCADVPGLSAPFPRPECVLKTGNHSLMTFELVLDTPLTADWPTYYLVPLASAVSELLNVPDVCDVALKSAVAETKETTRVIVTVRRLSLAEAASDAEKLRTASSDETLTKLFARRGLAPRTALESATAFGSILL